MHFLDGTMVAVHFKVIEKLAIEIGKKKTFTLW